MQKKIRPRDHGEAPATREAGLMEPIERRRDVARIQQVHRGGRLRRRLRRLATVAFAVAGLRSQPGVRPIRHVGSRRRRRRRRKSPEVV